MLTWTILEVNKPFLGISQPEICLIIRSQQSHSFTLRRDLWACPCPRHDLRRINTHLLCPIRTCRKTWKFGSMVDRFVVPCLDLVMNTDHFSLDLSYKIVKKYINVYKLKKIMTLLHWLSNFKYILLVTIYWFTFCLNNIYLSNWRSLKHWFDSETLFCWQ